MNLKRIKKFKIKSLSGKLVFSVVALLCVFVIGILSITIFIYSRNMETTYINQVVSTSEQALSNYTNYIDNVVLLSDALQVKIDNQSKEEVIASNHSYFDEIMSVSNSMKSISLYDTDGNLISSNSFFKSTSNKESIVKEDWFKSALNNPLINCFSKVDTSSSFTLSKMISMNNGSDNAILNISYDFSGIVSMIDEAKLGDGGHVFIFNNDYETVYTSIIINSDELDIIKENVLGKATFKRDDNSFFLYISTIPNTRWRVAIASNINALNVAKKELFIHTLTYTLIALIVFSLFVFLISRQITKPLVTLQKRMEKIDDLNVMSLYDRPLKGTKEVEFLNKSYIALMNRIHDLTIKIVNEQKEQNKAELQALQNQINPHFLYNTLDSIVYLIDENENEKAENMIIALSRFFRISISRGKNIIPVKDELDHVKYYLKIQKMRFGERFQFEIIAQEEVKSLFVLKLILQPIVENAIIHGIGETSKECKIIINAYLKDEYLCFDISDNGFGMLQEKIDEIYASFKDKTIHKGVGISNVYHRLRLFYGEKADITIQSKLDYGTKVHIQIPREALIENEENKK